MSKARILADLISDSQITASEIVGLELNSIQEGDTVVQVSDTGSGGKVVVRVDGADNAEFNANGMVIPKGTTAERDPAAVVGTLRYNTTTGFFETFTSSGWGAVATPPSITSVTPSNFNGEAGATFTVDGAFFDVDTTASFKGADGTEYAVATLTFVSSTQITLTNATNLPAANEPFRVKVTNGAGLSVESIQGIDAGSVPAFTTAAGSLASTTWTNPVSVTVNATDAENTITGYSVTEGNLPAGLSLNATTGAITGTSVGQATTTYTFTIGATDSAGNTNTRQFNIQIVNAAPVWSSPAEGSTVELETNAASSITLSATDPEGEAVSYTSGALPTGLSISGNVISGAPTVDANTSVAITASDGFASSVRNFFINVAQPFQQQFISHSTSTQTYNYTGSIEEYLVPTTGSYRLLISGAMGGRPADNSYAPSGFNESTWRGRGRRIEVYYNFEAGEVLKFVVGEIGDINSSGNGGNGGGVGGGGSFLWKDTGTVLIGAAGGGGGGSIINTSGQANLLYGRDGNNANDGLDSHAGDSTGGVNGGDGREFLSHGGGTGTQNRARGWLSMSAAMNFRPNPNSQYGTPATFGGGGLSRNGDHAGGGGGGYSGGGYGDYGHNSGFGNTDGRNGGGGGGSYAIADSRSSNLAFGIRTSNGQITIEAALS
jgi:hypothetical protein